MVLQHFERGCNSLREKANNRVVLSLSLSHLISSLLISSHLISSHLTLHTYQQPRSMKHPPPAKRGRAGKTNMQMCTGGD
jgi:hypothetical protein